MEKKLIDNSLVLKEALSIPSCINNFVKNDLNNYDEIADKKGLDPDNPRYLTKVTRTF